MKMKNRVGAHRCAPEKRAYRHTPLQKREKIMTIKNVVVGREHLLAPETAGRVSPALQKTTAVAGATALQKNSRRGAPLCARKKGV